MYLISSFTVTFFGSGVEVDYFQNEIQIEHLMHKIS